MQTGPPPTVTDAVVTAALRDSWSLVVDELTYLPTGAGGYHWRASTTGGPRFVTVDDLDTKPWLGRDRATAFAGLTSAYATARSLHDEGLALALSPLAADDGAIAVRVDEQHSIVVCPFVEGAAGVWGMSIGPADRGALLDALAALHAPARVATVALARRRRELPERADLLDALADLDGPWTGGPRAEDARAALATHTSALRQRVAHFDALAAQLDRADPPVVVTHGEPHPGNLLVTRDGLRLLDWDTVALAEPERDLWMLDTGPGALDRYVEATGRPVDPLAIELWCLAWTLSDLAWLTDGFRRGGTREPDRHWDTYLRLLEGGSATPFGP